MTQNSDQYVTREEHENLKRQVAESLDIIKKIIQQKIVIDQGGYELISHIQVLDNLIGEIEKN